MTSDLFYFGLTQKSAPLGIREKLPACRDAQMALSSQLSGFVDGCLMLATCERFEIYSSIRVDDADAVASRLCSLLGLQKADRKNFVTTLCGPSVARQLLCVAAGLDSRIVGERQILGQVRNAHRLALEESLLDAQLSVLVQTAVRTGKRVRTETNLDQGGRSIVSLTMDWLRDQCECMGGKSVTILGTGRLASLVASALVPLHPRRLTITGRNQVPAATLARQFGAVCADLGSLAEILTDSDILFACTASPAYLIDASMLTQERKHPLRLVDLCVPRNVDPQVASFPFVKLSHVDDMVACELSGRPAAASPPAEAIQQAWNIVDHELRGFLRWRRERRAAPRITELLTQAATVPGSTDKRAMHERIMRIKAEALA